MDDEGRNVTDAGPEGLCRWRFGFSYQQNLLCLLLRRQCRAIKRESAVQQTHAGVRAAVHQYLVNANRLSVQWGQFYDQTFEDRQEADYQALTEFEAPRVYDRIAQASEFVEEMRRLLHKVSRA